MGRPTAQALEKEERKPEVRASPESASPAPGGDGACGSWSPPCQDPVPPQPVGWGGGQGARPSHGRCGIARNNQRRHGDLQ